MSDNSFQDQEGSDIQDDGDAESSVPAMLSGDEQDNMQDTSVSDESQKEISSESDSDYEEQIIRTGPNITQSQGRKVNKNERITPPFLTKYERARVIGTRALQISKNSPIYVDPKETTDPILVAQQELNENKIPFIIRRYLPNGNFEDWELQELERLD